LGGVAEPGGEEPAGPRRTRFRNGSAEEPTVRSPLVTRSLSPKRLFILGIVIALGVSYLGSVRGYLAQRDELSRQQVALTAMIAERDSIRARLQSLDDPAVAEARARELGFVKVGEKPIRVTGLELAPPAAAPRRTGGGFWSWLPGIF
jgi:cell division protein FtsB